MSIFNSQHSLFQHFEEIAKIPHGSYHEEKIADYIEAIAKQNHLKYERDVMNNIIIFKEASEGFENHEPVILQGHMDMVNEKNNDSDHDCDHDPLDLYIEDGFLHARGTTLGADDGVAVCYMLSILTDKTLKHPPLECVFTVQEEVGLLGAAGLDVSSLRSKRMIGLDSGTEGETCTSSSGGRDLEIRKKIQFEKVKDSVYTIEVKGLLGGHSGSCIHMGRANANKLIARILYRLLLEKTDIHIVRIQGGLKDNAIPRECIVTFSSQKSYENIEKVVKQCYREFLEEREITDPDIQVLFYPDESDSCLSLKESEEIIRFLYVAPNGCIEKSQMIKDLPILSLNMGVIKTEMNEMVVIYSIRSPLDSYRQDLHLQLQCLGETYHFTTEMSSDYPGWDYDPHSKMRQELSQCYKQYTGNLLLEVATHGGLETGILKGKIPGLDIVTMGPNMSYIHTPDEMLDIDSYQRTYELLIHFLERL